MRTLEKTRRLHLEEIKSALERQAHEGSGLVFLRRSPRCLSFCGRIRSGRFE